MNIVNANCLDAMRDMPASSVDAIVTDPPYGIAFMGVAWDTFNDGRVGGERTNATFDQVGGNHHPTCAADQARTRKSENAKFQTAMTPIFSEALRVAKPGAHLLAFGGTRTYHRLACAIEDAGWEIRDCIMWVYGSGFPKSMDVSKAIDKELGAERNVVGYSSNGVGSASDKMNHGHGDRTGHATGDGKHYAITEPSSHEAKEWNGWGTALKPAYEPIILARKPLDGTVAANVLRNGTGAINIDACRVPVEPHDPSRAGEASAGRDYRDSGSTDIQGRPGPRGGSPLGRFPANIVHDGSQMVLDLFPDGTGASAPLRGTEPSRTGAHGIYNAYGPHAPSVLHDARGGSAARFFYCAKAARSERGEGNDHPTVKPVALMRWLVRLVCRPGGLVLDPFCGSGTTGIACREEGMDFIGIEKNEDYFKIARNRVLGNGDTAPFQMEIPFG